ncbi:MAG: hypothetical protein ACKODX_12025 [Gemmata sp.]
MLKSFIGPLTDDQLGQCVELGVTLNAYYRKTGLEVAWVPAADHADPAMPAADLERVW